MSDTSTQKQERTKKQGNASTRVGAASASPPTSAAARLKNSAFERLGLHRPIDFLLHLPLRYEDETRLTPLAAARRGLPLVVELDIIHIEFQPRGMSGKSTGSIKPRLTIHAGDGEHSLLLRFPNAWPSQRLQFEKAQKDQRRIRCFGEIREGFNGPEMIHPRCQFIAPSAPPSLPTTLTPVYPTTAGLSQSALRKEISRHLSALIPPSSFSTHTDTEFSDTLPVEPLEELLAPRYPELLTSLQTSFVDALRILHSPPPGLDTLRMEEGRHPASQRLIFEELLAQQLSLRRASQTRSRQVAPMLASAGTLESTLVKRLAFALTGAQQRVRDEIRQDMSRPIPMQRLVQGDVGSGKTILAALACCQAIEAGFQAAFMAPTEILAEQHYLKLQHWLGPLGIKIVWLSGSLNMTEKRRAQQNAAFDAQIIVGTHALIQDNVDLPRLALAIVDEQHRFGVAQRLALRNKGDGQRIPHQLMMSATPIPRTLAMTYYADLDVSIVDELPPGRTAIRTRLMKSERRHDIMAALGMAARSTPEGHPGQQAYWVCPLIEESETLQLQTALDTHAELCAALPDLTIGLVHGRLKAEEKAAVMEDFSLGKLAILVATTVIEVGVDVPNASLMVIEHAERFGLSQLHQLRGRVGRGLAESTCILLYASPLSPMAKERLKIIYENADGFEIARQDLLLRGPGEFIGHRQSGVPLLRLAHLERDADLIEPAQYLASRLLESPRYSEIVNAHLDRWLGDRDQLLHS